MKEASILQLSMVDVIMFDIPGSPLGSSTGADPRKIYSMYNRTRHFLRIQFCNLL